MLSSLPVATNMKTRACDLLIIGRKVATLDNCTSHHVVATHERHE